MGRGMGLLAELERMSECTVDQSDHLPVLRVMECLEVVNVGLYVRICKRTEAQKGDLRMPQERGSERIVAQINHVPRAQVAEDILVVVKGLSPGAHVRA